MNETNPTERVMVERDDVISLQDYLVVLRRQRWLVVLTTVVVVVAALAVSFAQTPIYEAETELAVEPLRRSDDTSLEQLLAPSDDAVSTERVVMTSRPVAERAAAQLGVDDVSRLIDTVRVEAVPDTRVVRIVAADPDPATAVATSDAFANAYLDFRRDQAVDEVLSARSNLDERAAELRGDIAELEAEEEAAPADEVEGLEVERQALLAQLAQVLASASELGDTAEGLTGGGAILTPAEPPSTPVSPRPARTGALALILGLLLGVGLAFLRDHVDDVVRDESDFKRATGNRPILGRIPRYEAGKDGEERLITLLDPSALAAESYRELSAGVRFLLVTHGGAVGHADTDGAPAVGRSILVASANAGEGKTASAANLAVAAARVGLRTVLVDTDLRKATVGRRFGLGRTTGLADALLNGDRISDHVVDVGVENLVVLPAGTIPPNPAELLASPAMRAVQQHLLAQADLVIYDSPAVLAVPDTLELGRFVDMAILVGRAGSTGRREIGSAVERLEQVGTEIAGTVLNGIDTKADGYYYAYYYAEQAADAKDKPGKPEKGKASTTVDEAPAAASPPRRGRRQRRADRRRRAASNAAAPPRTSRVADLDRTDRADSPAPDAVRTPSFGSANVRPVSRPNAAGPTAERAKPRDAESEVFDDEDTLFGRHR